MTDKQPVAVGYVRVSTKKDEQAASPDTQRMLIEGEAARQGWRLARWFEDKQSGWRGSAKRPDYRELKAYLSTTRLDYVVVADMSRLGRDLMEYMQLSREVLEPLGVELYLVRGVNGPGDQVELVRIIDAWLAEHYSRDLSKRTRDGMERLARSGGWGSVIPYGYRSSKRGPDGKPNEPCVLWVHEEHAPIVREMYSLAAAGESARAIARRLNARGIPSPKGAQWSTASVLRILRNRVYLGEVWHNGELMDKGHVPLIEAPLFDTVQARGSSYRQRASVPGEWLLPRLLTTHWMLHRKRGEPRPVHYHGERMSSGRRAYRKDAPVRTHVQRAVAADDLAQILPSYIDAEALEHAVMAKIMALADMGADAFWAEVGQHKAGADDSERTGELLRSELRQLGMQLAKEQQRLDNALDFGLRERCQEYAVRIDEIERQQQLLKQQLKALKSPEPSEPPRRGRSDVLRVQEKVNIARELWQRGARAELRDFLSAILMHIDLRTDGERLLVFPVLHDLPELHPGTVKDNGEGGNRTPRGQYYLLAAGFEDR